jgi:hypothetical protein
LTLAQSSVDSKTNEIGEICELLSGITNIASACRRFSARPKMALELIGIRI